jgi:hypothetical protein
VPKKRKKLTIKQAAAQLTAIAENHLKDLPEEEQDLRVELFSRSVAILSREKSGILPKRRGSAGSRKVSAARR